METILRGACIYFVVLAVTRLSGRRALSQMTAFDLILIMILAEATGQAMQGEDFSLAGAALLIITLVTIDIGLAYVREWWPAAEKLIDGRPTLLIVDGEEDRRALRRSRVSLDDVLQAARSQHGLERMAQVKHAILENDGHISIIPRKDTE